VIVKAKSARGVGDSVTTVKLANLRPEAKVLRGRPKAYGLGLFLLAASIGLGFAAFLVRGLGLLSHDTAMTLMSAAGGVLFVSVPILSVTFRKIEYFPFVSNQGNPLSHDHVRQAVRAFIAQANQFHQSMVQVADSPVPAKGNVAFYGRTDAGLLKGEAREEDLSTGRHPLSPLYFAGHSVITELRKASQFKAGELQ
jgi:hypothetical protein